MPSDADDLRDTWREYQRLVIYRLTELETQGKTRQDMLLEIKAQLDNLKGRAAAWGAVAGLVGASVVGLVFKLAFGGE